MNGSTSSPASSSAASPPQEETEADTGEDGDEVETETEAEEDAPSALCTANEKANMTEPDKLGPLEPGTAVKLNGIVWHETEKGK